MVRGRDRPAARRDVELGRDRDVVARMAREAGAILNRAAAYARQAGGLRIICANSACAGGPDGARERCWKCGEALVEACDEALLDWGAWALGAAGVEVDRAAHALDPPPAGRVFMNPVRGGHETA